MVFAEGSNVGQSMESLLWMLLTWTVPLLVSLLYKTLSFSLLSTRPRAKADRFVQSRYNQSSMFRWRRFITHIDSERKRSQSHQLATQIPVPRPKRRTPKPQGPDDNAAKWWDTPCWVQLCGEGEGWRVSYLIRSHEKLSPNSFPGGMGSEWRWICSGFLEASHPQVLLSAKTQTGCGLRLCLCGLCAYV